MVPHDGHLESHHLVSRPIKETRVVPISTPAVLSLEDLTLEFEGRTVLDRITAEIPSEQLTCLCGANGAGKTQFIRVGLGFNKPTLGFVKLLGGAPQRQRRHVGYVPQFKSFNRNFPATVLDVLIAAKRGAWPLFHRFGERDAAAACLQRVGGLPLLDKELSVLSGGELQRVFLARALVQQPKILILDEPLAAVDTQGRSKFLDLLDELRHQNGLTLLLVTHSEPVVRRLADWVLFLEKGRLVGAGPAKEMLQFDELRQVAFFGHDHETAIHSEDHE